MGVIDDLSAMPDTGFGCAVTNRFDQLLDDEADPFDILRQAQAEKQKKKKKEEQKKADPGKQGKRESQKERKVPLSGGGEGGQKALLRVGPIQNEESGERRAAFRERRYNEMDTPLEYSIVKPQEQSDRGVRGGRGGARGRGGRGGAYPRGADATDPRRKREFDRHSGSVKTGVRPEEKRGGNGPHNWGSMRDQMSAVMDGIPTEDGGDAEGVQEVPEVDRELRVTEADAVGPGPAAVEMSLDEWKALQAQSRPKMELNLRRADTNVPSKAVVIHQSKHLEDVSDGLVEEEEDGHFFRRPVNDITSRMEINFGCLARPMRGGRGGRGGRGRGVPAFLPETEPQPPSEAAPALAPAPAPAPAPNPNDPEDFPALKAGEA
ncbi:hypothetical protein SKAU_G00285380 [Synaphobranchus kaupii]|uniref:Hyaluronan/mRNA-binding protein domain-containing protein n=1 Tax=Synaphobranchus kaupii TaxID=118154 RepID=A0A9Q1IMA2_SYNKA|nr:hypothetical protein SKAU_G00285380 [Synaphobranchus kaupii]